MDIKQKMIYHTQSTTFGIMELWSNGILDWTPLSQPAWRQTGIPLLQRVKFVNVN